MDPSNLENVKEEANDWETEELEDDYYKQNSNDAYQTSTDWIPEVVEPGEVIEFEENGTDDNAIDMGNSLSDWMNIQEKELDEMRKTAQKINSQPREDCPVCGDKANGLHYGIYSCEGCKNFFKRSVVLTKEYICSNRQNCDIGIVIDMSGMKRKGARCQACRYVACLNAGMFHSGYQRTRGGSHHGFAARGRPPSLKKLMHQKSTSPPMQPVENENEQASGEPLAIGFEGTASKNHNTMDEKSHHLSFPSNIKMGAVFMETDTSANSHTPPEQIWHSSPSKRPSFDESIGVSSSKRASFDESIGLEQKDNSKEELMKRNNRPIPDLIKATNDLVESIYKDDYLREASKNKELMLRLKEKDKQLKISERQIDSMRKHMLISQNITIAQQEEITKLKEEMARMKMFQNTVNNYGGKSHKQHETYQNGSGMDFAQDLESHTLLEPEIGINEEEYIEEEDEDKVKPTIKNELCRW